VIEPRKEILQSCEVCQYVLFDPSIPWNEEEFEEKRLEKMSDTSIV
jgi:rubredoxin